MAIAQPIYPTSGLINLMVNAVTKASRKLIRDFNELDNVKVSRKHINDFVSTADKTSERILIAELSLARPDYSILSEESGFIKGKDERYSWIIDPLDGTVNFIHGFGYWCISIALKFNEEVIAGVVYDPLRNEIFLAEKGKGAFLNNKRLRSDSIHYLDEGLLVFTGINQELMNLLIKKHIPIRKTGSTALNLAYVAAGRFNAFIGHGEMNEWDIAAGLLIAKESGLIIHSNTENLLKSNKLLIAEIDIIKEIEKIIQG